MGKRGTPQRKKRNSRPRTRHRTPNRKTPRRHKRNSARSNNSQQGGKLDFGALTSAVKGAWNNPNVKSVRRQSGVTAKPAQGYFSSLTNTLSSLNPFSRSPPQSPQRPLPPYPSQQIQPTLPQRPLPPPPPYPSQQIQPTLPQRPLPPPPTYRSQELPPPLPQLPPPLPPRLPRASIESQSTSEQAITLTNEQLKDQPFYQSQFVPKQFPYAGPGGNPYPECAYCMSAEDVEMLNIVTSKLAERETDPNPHAMNKAIWDVTDLF